MNTLRVGIECAATAAVMWSGFFVIGWPVWTFIAGRVPLLSVTTGAPFTGIAVVEIAGWYWAHAFSLDPFSYGIVAVGAVASGVLAFRRRLWERLDRPLLVRLGAQLVVLASAVSALFTLDHHKVFRGGRLSTGVLGFTVDLPNYALWAEHLRHATVADPGGLVGHDIGAQIGITTAGTFVALGAGSAWSATAPWASTLPFALVVTFLIACSARDLAALIVPRIVATGIGLAAISASLFVYSAAHYPLSQLLGTAGVVAATCILAGVARTDSVGAWRGALMAAPPAAVVIMSYPHMALLAPPIVGGIALAASWGPDWRARAGRTLVAAFGALLVCVFTIPERLLHTVDYARLLAGAEAAGVALPLITPHGLLGFQDEFSKYVVPGEAAFVLEALALGAVLGLVLALARGADRARGTLAAAATLVVLASYGVVFLNRGESYTAWKWAVFYLPLLIVGALAGGVTLIIRLVPRRTSVVIATAAIAAVVSIQGVGAYRATDVWDPYVGSRLSVGSDWFVLDESLRTLGDGPAWRGIDSVTVDLNDSWAATWATYFAPVRHTVFDGVLAQDVPPDRHWWRLEEIAYPPDHPPGTQIRIINDRFQLAHEVHLGVEAGDLWVVGNCSGLYRFDGVRWQGLERTIFSGGWSLEITTRPRPPGTRAPVLVRTPNTTSHLVDALVLEHLPNRRARFVVQTAYRQPPGVDVVGSSFDLTPGIPVDVNATFDPLTGEVATRVDGRQTLSTRITFLRPLQGTVRGSGRTVNPAVNHFPGTITVKPSSNAQCLAARAAEG
jgi:hypothetical protein